MLIKNKLILFWINFLLFRVMVFKKRTFYIAILVISIIGLFVVQYQYLRVGLNLAKVQFSKKVETVNQGLQDELKGVNKLTFMIGTTMTNDSTYFTVDIDSVREASAYFLKDFIKYKLALGGIDTDFTFALFSRDSTFYLKSPAKLGQEKELMKYPIEMQGYLPGLVHEDLVLELQFMDLNSYFLSKLNGLTIPSLIFFIAIILVVIWILRSFYWQNNFITTTNEFINNLTHELKTPVFSIGLATKILEEEGDAKNKPVVAIIRQEVERLKKHIDKVLDIGNLEQGKKAIQLTKMNIRPLLEKLCAEFNALSSLEKFEFTYNLQPGNYIVNSAPAHLENAINNVLENAKKYASDPKIELSAEKEEKRLRIRVSDNGIGIAQKDLHKVFKKYYRVPNGDLYKTKGYGLGLSYAKRVVDGHKGKITIVSDLEKGTVVTIIIPLIQNGEKI